MSTRTKTPCTGPVSSPEAVTVNTESGATVKLAWNQLTVVLFGLRPTDVTAVVVAIVLMAVVATLAGFLPARRASKVDPLAALRVE